MIQTDLVKLNAGIQRFRLMNKALCSHCNCNWILLLSVIMLFFIEDIKRLKLQLFKIPHFLKNHWEYDRYACKASNFQKHKTNIFKALKIRLAHANCRTLIQSSVNCFFKLSISPHNNNCLLSFYFQICDIELLTMVLNPFTVVIRPDIICRSGFMTICNITLAQIYHISNPYFYD